MVDAVEKLTGHQPVMSYHFIADGGIQEDDAKRVEYLCFRTGIAITLHPHDKADAKEAEKEFDEDPADGVVASAELAEVWRIRGWEKGQHSGRKLSDTAIVRMIQEVTINASYKEQTNG